MSKIRPYTQKDFSAFHLCGIRRKNKPETFYTIVGCDQFFIQITDVDCAFYRYGCILEEFEFLDGSACGIEEDEI